MAKHWQRSAWAVLLAVLGLVAFAGPATAAEVRLALVIAQSSYSGGTDNLPPLSNTKGEADLVAQALSSAPLNFQVTRADNLTRNNLAKALTEFRRKVEAAGSDAVAFIYFTGHGAQSPEDSGRLADNFLLGVDADIRVVSDLPFAGVSVQEQVRGFEFLNAKAVVFVVDACRNNLKSLGFKSGTKGLAAVKAAPGMLIAYATAADDVAVEGVYAPVLARELKVPGRSLSDTFNEIKVVVARNTDRKQRPYNDDLLFEKIYLVPLVIDTSITEKVDFAEAVRVNTVAGYEGYKRKYPNSDFVAMADAAISRLTPRPAPTPTPSPPPLSNTVLPYNPAPPPSAYVPPGVAPGKVLTPLITASVAAERVKGLPGDIVEAAIRGDAIALYNLGRKQETHFGGNNNAGALRVYDAACDLGHAPACTDLGWLHQSGEAGAVIDYAKSRKYSARGCAGGNMMGCNNLGILVENGRGGGAPDKNEAARLYRLACDGAIASGCFNLGVFTENGWGGIVANKVEAVRLYRYACDGKVTKGCNSLGYMYEKGTGGLSVDKVEAVRLYRIACDANEASGCVNLGYSYEIGQGGLAVDKVSAEQMYRKACVKRAPNGCASLGYLLEKGGGGVVANKTEAVTHYRFACDNGIAISCADLGYMYQTGQGGLTLDYVEAVRLHRKACDAKNPIGCEFLADLYDLGLGGLPKDRNSAISYYRLALQYDPSRKYARTKLTMLGVTP